MRYNIYVIEFCFYGEMIRNIFKKQDPVLKLKGENAVTAARNWYNDRYTSLVMQRNFLMIFIVFICSLCLLGAVYVRDLSEKKTVKPFMIQIDNTTGETKVIDPFKMTSIDGNESLYTYFLVKYLKAREEFDKVYFQRNYDVTVRLFSESGVYRDFITTIRSEESPVKKYGDIGTASILIRSISFLDLSGKEKIAQIRFRKNSEISGRQSFKDKIATIGFKFQAMSLTNEERFDNPIGFRISKYRVDDEIFNNNN